MKAWIRPVLPALVVCCVSISTWACTTPGKVQDIETKDFQEKGGSEDGKIGLNSKKQAVIRDNISVQDELMSEDLAITHLHDEVQSERYALQTCRKQLLAGGGHVGQLPDIDKVKEPTEIDEKMGMDEDGNLRIVREQSLDEKLKTERAFEVTLKRALKILTDEHEDCDQQLAIARSHSAGTTP